MQKVEEIAQAQASLMHRVFADYDEILAATGSTDLKKDRGAIYLYDTEEEYRADQWQVDLRKRLGFEQHRLSPADVKAMVPCLKPDKGVAIMMPHWQHLLDPAKVTARIADHCISEGGHWMQDRVSSVAADNSGVSMQTESGKRIAADQLVVAAGAWSNTIAEQLDYKVPLIAKRGYHSQIAIRVSNSSTPLCRSDTSPCHDLAGNRLESSRYSGVCSTGCQARLPARQGPAETRQQLSSMVLKPTL